MGTRVGMKHVQEQPYVQLSTSHHTYINIPTCGVFTISITNVLMLTMQIEFLWLLYCNLCKQSLNFVKKKDLLPF